MLVNAGNKLFINKYGIKILTIILASIILLIGFHGIMKLHQIVVINDEFGYWSIAAHLAGYDWSGLTPTTPFYSHGYSLLLVPLFWLFKEPSVMYQAAVAVNIFLLCSAFLLLVRFGKKLFPEVNVYIITLLSFSVTLYSNNIAQVKIAWAETLLYFLYILIANLLINICTKPTIKNIIFVTSVSAYTYMVHQRSLGVLISVIILIVLLFVPKKLKLSHLLIAGVCLGFFLLISISLKDYFTKYIWINESLLAMNDYSGQIDKVKSIFSFEGMKLLFESIVGKLYYILTSTFLIMGAGFILILKKCYSCIKSALLTGADFLENIEKNGIYIFLILSFLSTLMISAISMYQPSRLDMLVYGRYVEFTYAPILFCGFIYLIMNRENIKETLGTIVIVILMGILVQNIFRQLNTTAFNPYCGVGIYKYFSGNWSKDGVAFHAMAVSIFVFIVIILFNGLKIKKLYAVLFACLICCTLWINNANIMLKDVVYPTQDKINKNLSISAGIIGENESNQQVVYIDDSNQVGDVREKIKQMQYWLYDSTIIPISLDEFENMDIAEGTYILILRSSKQYDILNQKFKLLNENDIFGLFTVA